MIVSSFAANCSEVSHEGAPSGTVKTACKDQKKTHKGFGLLPGESVQFWQDPAHESTGVGALSICAFVGQSPILPACGAGIDGHW
jgi:hypothetical protein